MLTGCERACESACSLCVVRASLTQAGPRRGLPLGWPDGLLAMLSPMLDGALCLYSMKHTVAQKLHHAAGCCSAHLY